MKRFNPFALKVLLSRRWRPFLIAFLSCTCLTAVLYLTQGSRYQATGALQLKTSTGSGLRTDQSPDSIDQFLARVFLRTSFLTPEVKALESERLLQQLIEQLELRDSRGNLTSPRTIRSRLALKAPSDEKTVEVVFSDQDPAQAEAIVNTLMDLYIKSLGPESPEESVNLTSVIQPALQETKTLLGQTKQAVYQVQLGANRAPLSPNTRAGDQSLSLQSIYSNAQRQLSGLPSDIQALQQQLAIARTSEIRTLLTEVIELTQQREQLLKLLLELFSQPQDSETIPSLILRVETKVFEVERFLTLSTNTYNAFLGEQQEPLQNNSPQSNGAVILKPATVSSQASRPHTLWFFGLGSLLSLSSGIVAAWIRDQQDPSFLSIADFYDTLQLPILGLVPYSNALKQKSKPLPGKVDPLTNTQDIEIILNTLKRLSNYRLPQVFVFTSTLKNEGKTALLAKIAIALVKAGRKTLVIDADLYHPGQSQWWSLSHQLGLTDCLHARIQLGKALQRVRPNLDILLSGSMVKNPDITLNSPGIALLLEELRTRYDHILIDTPALDISPHGYLVANNADATLLISRLQLLNSTKIALARNIMSRSLNRFWGAILNDFKGNLNTKVLHREIKETQWDASMRLQKKRLSGELEISTFSAIGSLIPYSAMLSLSKIEQEKQDQYLYNLPLEELHKLVDSLWESWVAAISIVLEEEEEVVQQGEVVQRLQHQVKHGSQYARLSTEVVLKEEQEKFKLLADAFVGQRPHLMKEQAVLQQYLEVLYARTDAEFVPPERKEQLDP